VQKGLRSSWAAGDLTQYFAELGVRMRYLHSEVEVLERTAILADLRRGTFDVLVGINLLREGLDPSEVSLVAISDWGLPGLNADKEGYLRSSTSLIQTIGRAARNLNGAVILYADRMTDSLKQAVEETNRRLADGERAQLRGGVNETAKAAKPCPAGEEGPHHAGVRAVIADDMAAWVGEVHNHAGEGLLYVL